MSSAPLTAGQPSGNNQKTRPPRYRIESLMYVDLGLGNGGFPINVSEGGMAFHGVQRMSKDQIVQVRFKLPGLSNSVESVAQIAWLNELGKGGGLRFIDMPESAHRQIKEWLTLQASICANADNNSIPPGPLKLKNFKPLTAMHLVGNQNHSTPRAEVGAARAPHIFSGSKGSAAKIHLAGNLAAATGPRTDAIRTAAFRDPQLRTEKRNLWSVSFPSAIVASLMFAAFLGIASYQLHWDFLAPDMNGNLLAAFNEFVRPPAPRFSPETQPVANPPRKRTDSELATAPLADSAQATTDQPEDSVAPEVTAPDSHPAKRTVPLKMKPPKGLSKAMGKYPKALRPGLAGKSLAVDIAPPTFGLLAKPELLAQIPAPPPAMPPPAPAVHEPAPQTGKFEPAQIVYRKSPVYPAAVQAAGFSGSVELHFKIGVDGNVHDVTVAKGNLLLAHSAMEALQTWRYRPAHRDGVPVESDSSMLFVFDPN